MSRLPSVSSVFCMCLVFILMVKYGESGECCRVSTDRYTGYQNMIWCPDYCCVNGGQHYCCGNPWFRASRLFREGFCNSWFTHSANLWAPILIAVIIIALFVGLGICCCCIPGFCFCC